MKKGCLLFLLIIYVINLSSQNFAPPEELSVDWGYAKLMWEPPSLMKVVDTLNNYNPGDYLAVVSPNWTTWSNTPGIEEDAVIINYNNFWNAAKIENETNLVMDMDTYTSGRFSFYIQLYVPENYSGYFNIQKTNIPGEEMGFEIFFGADTTATVNAGGESAIQFPYWNHWLKFNMIIDLDNDWAEFYFDDYLIIDYQWSLGASGLPGLNTLGGVNISTEILQGSNDTAMFYVKDVKLREQYTSEQGLAGYNIYLDDYFIEYLDSPLSQRYYFQDLCPGDLYLAGISSIYSNPIGESEIVELEIQWLAGGFVPFPPENVTATVQNYNDVILTWILPYWQTHPLFGYHIYRDNVFIHRILGPDILSYYDYSLPNDDYEYFMEAIYIGYTDFPWQSDVTYCTISFPIPDDVTATTYEPDILLEWTLEPPDSRELLYFKVYRDGDMIAEEITEYSFLDVNLTTGTYAYNVSAVFSGDWESELSDDVIIDHVNSPENTISYSLVQISNYPNPFNPTTTISFSISEESKVDLSIYNINGQKIKSLLNDQIASGEHSIVWYGEDDSGKKVSSGVYLYNLILNDKTELVKKCLLLK